jgi:hypothetical protein
MNARKGTTMKTIKAFALASIITVLFSAALSGCYTQLACVNDEQESAVEPPQIILYQPEIVSVFVPMPVFIQQPSPGYNVLPTAGATSTAAPAQSEFQPRTTGYQRPDPPATPQPANPVSDSRTSGSTRNSR